MLLNILNQISDFGMSRDLEDGAYYVSQGGKIPVKWTAPEVRNMLAYSNVIVQILITVRLQALHFKKYSTASDVWSFGCLMYEIWSLGHKPFEEYRNADVSYIPPPACLVATGFTVHRFSRWLTVAFASPLPLAAPEPSTVS